MINKIVYILIVLTISTQASIQVLSEYWDGNLPINPTALARKLGIIVKPIEFVNYSGIAYREEGICYIEYNNSESVLRQRFTIAHELGHHVLQHIDGSHKFYDDPSKFSLNVSIPQEIEANTFAIELLIPELVLKHFIFYKNITSLNKLSKLFSMSGVAMQFRLQKLGLL